MTEKDKAFRFEELDHETVNITFLNGSEPFEVQLNDLNWGLMDDIFRVQEEAESKPEVIGAFFNEHIEGGGKAVPIKFTMPLFQAIAEYMKQVMDTQKN